jgi:hypothetical protein
MTDKVVHLTKDGYIPNGGTSTTFDIPLTTGTLSETNAAYMFEINLIAFANSSSDSFAARYFMHVLKRGGTFNITNPPVEDWQEGADGGTLTSAVVDVASPNSTLVRLTLSCDAAGPRWWRTFITVYVKDDSI